LAARRVSRGLSPGISGIHRTAGGCCASLLLIVLLLLAATPARALDPTRRLTQYGHSAWRTQDGAFGGTPIVLTQTADGYLWAGTTIGLSRYNGSEFSPWTPPTGKRLLDARIFSLGATADGGLWIGTGSGTSLWKDGELVNYRHPYGRIESLVADRDGAGWIVRTQSAEDRGPLCRLNGDDVRCFNATQGMPFESAMNIVRDTTGNLWVGGYYGLARWKDGSSSEYFLRTPGEDEGIGTIKGLTAGNDGSVWTSIEARDTPLRLEQYKDGRWATHLYPQIQIANADVMALFVDRDNFLWVGTAHNGIYRIRDDRIEHFGNEDGLSSNAIGSFFQDHEGTIWVVTSSGVDNFHDLHVENFSMHEGMYADGASSLAASNDGTVWTGNFQSLNYLRDGKISSITEGHGLPGRNVTTLFEDHAGRLWLGVDSGLWVYENNHFRSIRHADGSLLGNVFSINEDIDHSIWVRAGPNLDRIRDYKVREESNAKEIGRAYILAPHPEGGVVLGMVTGDMIRFHDGHVTPLPDDGGSLESGPIAERTEDQDRHVRDLLVQPDGSIWGTNAAGFFIWKDGKRHVLTPANGLPCDYIFGLLDDRRGSLWLATACGLIKITDQELARWQSHPDTNVTANLVVGTLDGVQPGLTSLKPQIISTPDGKIWLVNARLLQMFDPNDPRRNEVVPPVHIEQITADRKVYLPQPGLKLPPRSRDIEIDFAALSFVVPQKVRYRYKLEGYDTDWLDPRTPQKVFYRDLSPAKYRFRVIACNNDGVWNQTGATLDFIVEPAYYQTGWFRVLCLLLAVFTLWVIYRVRMWRMRETLNARFDERMAERTRLARELHDTLLQTIQGSKMVAEDALENSTDADYVNRALERLSRWLDQAMGEGRAALNSLRTSTTEVNDLAQAFERAARECSAATSIEVRLQLLGASRRLHPIVRDEVYRIGYEAIRNACSHSEGTLLEVELSYARDLVLRVRDNGKGISPQIAAAGKDGHFGLKGMQERATRVGGMLTLSSSAYSGTEVELIVPSDVVFYRVTSTKQNFLGRMLTILRPSRRSSDDT
jgi:signal transduction histidine kinase/ligand-binding sensor domain-containing protein